MATFSRQAKLAELHHHLERQAQRFRREAPTHEQPAAGATAPGDTRKLRGIPAIARGVTGAIPGTTPHQPPRS
jgi:hypothetical protein